MYVGNRSSLVQEGTRFYWRFSYKHENASKEGDKDLGEYVCKNGSLLDSNKILILNEIFLLK